MHYFLAFILFVIAAYAANVTNNPDTFGYVLFGLPFVIPVGAFVLWLVGKLVGALFGRPSED
ncbi:hypothetical protein [Thalassospira marina]|uniref:Uncharacterized protein n=1 Tax=Thalassospira marina TaxID=2048283 RepID=A0A2N3KCZ5_9PROT|nr:hypothetical protein [Thalassospira marina]PKR48449.1 hypothetical protein COO20_24635 [Thalassospira marina]